MNLDEAEFLLEEPSFTLKFYAGHYLSVRTCFMLVYLMPFTEFLNNIEYLFLDVNREFAIWQLNYASSRGAALMPH